MSDKILTSVARKRSFPKASSNITKHLKEMEDAINDLEEQTQMHIEENQYTLSTPSEHGYNMIRFKLF
jgi:uncharacterized membrane protein YgaE (UPF0421/DUF939 family)